VFLRSFQAYSGAATSGIYFYDTGSTKMLAMEYVTLAAGSGSGYLRVQRMNSPTSDNTSVYDPITSDAANLGGPVYGGCWMRMRNDGTNLYFDVSLDGAAWHNIYSEAVGAFLTPNAIGYGGLCNLNSLGFTDVSVLSWA
jgi:hypothetical protein